MERKGREDTDNAEWHIYVSEIPHSEKGDFWVSFESTPNLEKTKANIYGRCLPCIQHLYEQLKQGRTEIDLGPAYHCWKVTAVLKGIDQCLALLGLYEVKFPEGHVYGKFGGSRSFPETKAVVRCSGRPCESETGNPRYAGAPIAGTSANRSGQPLIHHQGTIYTL